ncbi:helix-turn-helix domain-containing protein [Defluviimonas aestuarii]|uniref:helix-turn-helix domain-containing protein n=1 Tax=Albidovulum aestuarii TaxID=1130726 RepID=UPI00301522D6
MHPDRLRMLGLLRVGGPATATGLAERMDLNSGATSYHLRQLASYGFIEAVDELGTQRERWWRARHDATLYLATTMAPLVLPSFRAMPVRREST